MHAPAGGFPISPDLVIALARSRSENLITPSSDGNNDREAQLDFLSIY
jgi:hypothetical protein